MGVLKEAFDDVNEILKNNSNQIKNVLILGDQDFNREHFPQYSNKKYVDVIRNLYSSINFDVLDIQGNVNLKLNLNIIHDKLPNNYDFIIDLGTVEHVDNQYAYIVNINNWLNENGFYYSNVIDYKISQEQQEWLDHCFFYYSKEYFNFLSDVLDWKLIKFSNGYVERATESLIFCCLQKISNNKKEKKLKSIYDYIDIVYRESGCTKANMSDLNNVIQIIKQMKEENK